MKMASSAVLGAAGAIVSITMWVDNNNFTLNAHSHEIQRLQASDTIIYDQLRSIDARLARIEGKLDVILNHGRR